MSDYQLAVSAVRELTMEDTLRLLQWTCTRFNDDAYPDASDDQLTALFQAGALINQAAENTDIGPKQDWASEALGSVKGMDMFAANDLWETSAIEKARRSLGLDELIGGEEDVAEGFEAEPGSDDSGSKA